MNLDLVNQLPDIALCSILKHLRCAEFSPLWRPWTSWKQEMQTPSAIITKLFQWRRSGRRLRAAWAAWTLPRRAFPRRKSTLTGSSSTRLRWSYWCIMKFVRSVYGMDIPFPGSKVLCTCTSFDAFGVSTLRCLWMLPNHTNTTMNCITHSRVIFQYAPIICMIFFGWGQQGWWYFLARMPDPSHHYFTRECDCTMHMLTLCSETSLIVGVSWIPCKLKLSEG